MTEGTDALAGLRTMAAASLFPVEGEYRVAGLHDPVTVRRDAWGVPYIEAASLDDLWFAQGVVTAGERLFQVDLTLRAATGRLSEVFGDRTLDADRFARTVGFHRAGSRVATSWDDESRRMHQRFRAGVEAWVAAMPALPLEYTMLDLRPELPRDDGGWAAAFVYLSWALSGNALKELLRASIAEQLGPEGVAELLPPLADDSSHLPPGALHGVLLEAFQKPGARGSNAWAVAPARTSTGGALLANDPHLDAVQPGVWIEMHLSAPGYRARGVALPWSPGIVLGTTDHHAWGATNVSGDVQDLFVEELSDDGNSVRRGEGWAPLLMHHETIGVRGSDTVELIAKEGSHGPLLETFPIGGSDPEHVPLDALAGGSAIALAWTGLEHAIQPSLVVRASRAASFEEFRRAVSGVTCPGLNFVYADVQGSIGYACTGVVPVRRAGDGTTPVPAADGSHAWIGMVDVDDLPWAADPARGFVVTANDRPHDDRYPHLLGRDFHQAHRAGRIAGELARSDLRWDMASTAALQVDTVSRPAQEIVAALGVLEPQTDDQRLALELVRGWDGDVRADSAGAAVFQVWSGHVARRTLTPRLGDELFRRYHADREVWHCHVLPKIVREAEDAEPLLGAFDDAVAELRERLGDDPSGWRWGALHRVRLAHPLAAIPGVEPLLTAADVEVGGDETTVSQAAFDTRAGYDAVVIASWRAVYDLADLDRSVGVLPAGVSGNPASPHWNDQSSLWAAGESHPLPFTEPAVEEATIHTLLLLP